EVRTTSDKLDNIRNRHGRPVQVQTNPRTTRTERRPGNRTHQPVRAPGPQNTRSTRPAPGRSRHSFQHQITHNPPSRPRLHRKGHAAPTTVQGTTSYRTGDLRRDDPPEWPGERTNGDLRAHPSRTDNCRLLQVRRALPRRTAPSSRCREGYLRNNRDRRDRGRGCNSQGTQGRDRQILHLRNTRKEPRGRTVS